jgi:photosystem II stability/assembly factor-like uncharacterized protein
MGCGAAIAVDNQWHRIDVPVGADRITISPVNPNRVMIRQGFVLDRSNDGGTTWERVENGLPVGVLPTDLAADPDDADRWITSIGNRLWQTTDNGANWRILKEFPTTDSSFDIRDIDWCGSNIYVATSTEGVHRSIDDGVSFAPANVGMAGADTFATILGCRPDSPGVVLSLVNQSTNFAPATGTLYRSNDAGATWLATTKSNIANVSTSRPTSSIAFGTGGRLAMVIPSNPRQLAVSTDDGVTFVAGTTMPGPVSTTASLAWTSEATPRLLATGIGVNTSVDNGVTWGVFNTGLLLDTPGIAISTESLKVGPDGSIWVGSARVGVFKSSDGISAFVEQPVPYASARVNDIVIHPSQPGQMLAVLSRFGQNSGAATGISRMLVRTLDGGQTWTQVSNAFPFASLFSTEVKIDPGLGTSIADATLYMSDAPLTPGGHFWRSGDGGASWVRADAGLVAGSQSATGIRTLLLDPVSGGAGTRTLWLALDGRFTDNCASGTPEVVQNAARIWRTTNSGTSWASIDSFPLPTCVPGRNYRGPAPRPVALARASSGVLFAGTVLEPSLINANDPVPSVQNGFYRSLDGGTVWTHRSAGLPRRDPMNPLSSHRDITAIAVMPGNDQILFAAVGAIGGAAPQPGAIYKSTDGGDNWSFLGGSIDGDARELTIDPTNTQKMYYVDVTFRRVYASEDGGATWGSLSSGFFAGPNGTLVIDNVSPQPRLWMGGNAGLFHLTRAPDTDLDGVSSDEEAGAPNGGDGNSDSIADNQQANVASLGGLVFRGGGGPSPYLTIEVTPIVGTCNVIEDVRRFGQDQLPYDAVAARTDALEFAVANCTSARMTIYGEMIAADSGEVVRILGPTVVGIPDSRDWRDAIDSNFFAGRFSFTINDNAIGDNEPTPARMQFVARLGANAVFSDGFE